MDFLGLAVLFIVLLVIGLMQAGAAMGVMFAMHKLYPEKLTETTYGSFDFDNFQKPALQDLLVKLAIIFVGATLIIHMLDYLLIGRLIIRYRAIVCLVLFMLEVSAIGAGLFFIFKLDQFRLIVLTSASALFYLLCLWYLAAGKSFLI